MGSTLKPTLRSANSGAMTPALRPGPTLAQVGVRPRKSRGQNFLVQTAVAERIVAAAAIEPHDAVIEIGPGLGILTDRIAARPCASLTLIELDAALAARLGERFQVNPRVTLINQDFLRVDLDRLIHPPVRVIGNLPFNVAAAILERLCAHSRNITRMVLMFQREVADRIRARPGESEYGALSAFTALYWEIVEHFRVAAGNFHPKPKIDAEVLVFTPRQAGWSVDEEDAIRATIRASFSAPRKTMRNALAGGLKIGSAVAEQSLADGAIAPSSRPGTLAVEAFIRLARALRHNGLLLDSRDA